MLCGAFADVNLYQLTSIGDFGHQMIAESYINTGWVDKCKVEWFDHCILLAILPDLPIAEDQDCTSTPNRIAQTPRTLNALVV